MKIFRLETHVVLTGGDALILEGHLGRLDCQKAVSKYFTDRGRDIPGLKGAVAHLEEMGYDSIKNFSLSDGRAWYEE